MKHSAIYPRPSSRTLLAALCTLLLLAACHRPDYKSDRRIVKVSVIQVHDGSQSGGHEFVGTIEENSASDLSFNTAGQVTNIYVKDGQYVRQGTLLASVDKTTALSTFKAAQATLTQARDAYNRAKQVHDQGSLPEVKWIEMQTNLQKAESALEIAQQRLSDCDLLAPHDGTVDNRQVQRGSSVSPLQPVMRLIDLSNIYTRISVPDVDINRLRIGDTAQVLVSALGNEPPLNAVVSEHTVTADPLSHSYSVRLRILGHPKKLLPGMVCRVRFLSRQTLHGFEIPNRAVQLTHDGNRYVWVVSDSTAYRRKVSIGNLSPTGVIITQGLDEGDLVVTDGMSKISNGTKVEL